MDHRGTEGYREAERELTAAVIGAAIEVHRRLGPGLLESAYELCLARELALRGYPVKRQQRVPLVYRGNRVASGYRSDMIVEDRLLVEVKAVEQLAPIHTAQTLTYLRLHKLRRGLLINFNVVLLRDGIHRVVNG